jgi:hypothetical protein
MTDDRRPQTDRVRQLINDRRRSSVVGRLRLIGLLLAFLLCAISGLAQENKCALKLAELPNAPELLGFRMDMTTAQVKTRIPQVVFGRVDEFGVSKTSISPDFDSQIDKSSLAGIRTVSLDFLDGRLISLWFGYDGSYKWQTVPDFVKGISLSLRLPDSWRPWKVGQQLNCVDFQMTVVIVAEGPSFHIIDEAAERIVAARREAKEEHDAAVEEAAAAEVVADKSDMVYYLKGCSPTDEITDENRLVFKSKEEAEKAGYKLAKNCE